MATRRQSLEEKLDAGHERHEQILAQKKEVAAAEMHKAAKILEVRGGRACVCACVRAAAESRR